MMVNTKALSENQRRMCLEKIKKEDTPIMTGVELYYKGERKKFNVYKIPLSNLVYNPYNGRIGTKVRTFEVTKRTINPENEEDIKIIEEFLWDSKIDRNKKTLRSLLKYGQLEYGIVSKNGFIIDGNRRASILNRINNNRQEYEKKGSNTNHCQYFNAIILDDDADKKEIVELETSYQLGREEKLDYNPIEKYLKCKQLQDFGFSNDQIAKMMGLETSEKKVENYLNVLELMEEYLEYYDYKGMYTMLEKREGPLIDLNGYINAYKKQSGNAKTDWNPQEDDINDMKALCFDYIRMQYEGKEFRIISKNGKSPVATSFFANKEIWDKFKENHFETVDNIEDDPIEFYIERAKNDDEIIANLEERDDVWKAKVGKDLKQNLKYNTNKLENRQQADQPYMLLDKAINALNDIDENQDSLYNENILELIKSINKKSNELCSMVNKELKARR
ncbi:hypothetical protein K2V62_03305 [Mammaliicoccus sciuri]|nr:hypothetical protein [Mammaliicoccus sciuri]MCD8911899.1 hypothetical protein [Mammaliicoccus sciuri]